MSKFRTHSCGAVPRSHSPVHSKSLRTLRVALAALVLASASSAQGPNTIGSWSGLDWQCDTSSLESAFGLRQRMYHGALIPHGPYRGSVLVWGEYEDSTQTFLWNPSNPGRLFHVTNSWGGAPRDVHTVAMTWDDEGQLVIVNPAFHNSGGPLSSTWRIFPASLAFPPFETVPTTPCAQSSAEVRGNAWRALGNMSVFRYRPALLMLANGLLPSTALDRSTLVLGGTTTQSFLPINDGLEFWQALSPRSTPGGSTWSSTFVPNIAHPHTSPTPNETYVVQSGLIETRVEASPCTVQLADASAPGMQFLRSSFMAQDSLVQYETPPSTASNAPGYSAVVRPRYAANPSSWELWPRGFGGNFERSQGSVVLRHDRTGGVPGATGKNRVITIGGLQYSSASGGWVTNQQGAFEYRIDSGSSPNQGFWSLFNFQGVPTGRIDNSAVVLPTGDVMVVGGGRFSTPTNLPAGTTPDDVSDLAVPVHAPQLVRPSLQGGGSFSWSVSTMATAPVQPGYTVIAPRGHGHSAVLLPDGRVLVSGGNTTSLGDPSLAFSGAVFSPPYLFQSFRPSILSIQGSTFLFGETMTLEVARQENEVIDAVILLRPASTCFGFDSSQRYIELEFTPDEYDPGMGSQKVLAVAPPQDLGPTGHYMIFVLSHLSGASTVRVPSVGQFIYLN